MARKGRRNNGVSRKPEHEFAESWFYCSRYGGEPCLSQSPIEAVITVNRILKPDKWQALFDSDGKVSGFQKVLRSIALGGVDPSIRAEIWKFLHGCYKLGSKAEDRRKNRERIR